jgi:hypothetical protein
MLHAGFEENQSGYIWLKIGLFFSLRIAYSKHIINRYMDFSVPVFLTESAMAGTSKPGQVFPQT